MSDYSLYPMTICQLMPPGNWGARFDGSKNLQPLVGWAVVSIDGETKVKGMIAAEYQQVLPADCFEDFLCYEPTEFPESAVR